MTTAKTTLEFTASVNYGEYDCQISVYNNTAQTNGTVDGKNCSVSLALGENEIVVTAVCVEKNNAEKSWSFAVEKTEQLQIESSLKKDGLNRETDGLDLYRHGKGCGRQRGFGQGQAFDSG